MLQTSLWQHCKTEGSHRSVKTVTCKQWWNSQQSRIINLDADFSVSLLSPPSLDLVSVSPIQMETPSEGKISCYRIFCISSCEPVAFHHVNTFINWSNLLRHVQSNSPLQCSFTQFLGTGSKQHTQNCAMDKAIFIVINIFSVQLLDRAHQQNRRPTSYFSKYKHI